MAICEVAMLQITKLFTSPHMCNGQKFVYTEQGGRVNSVLGLSRHCRVPSGRGSCIAQLGTMANFSTMKTTRSSLNPLRPNNDLSQTSLCNIKGLSVSEVMRIENMVTQVKFY